MQADAETHTDVQSCSIFCLEDDKFIVRRVEGQVVFLSGSAGRGSVTCAISTGLDSADVLLSSLYHTIQTKMPDAVLSSNRCKVGILPVAQHQTLVLG